MAEKPAEAVVAPNKAQAAAQNIYLDLDTKEIVKIIGDTTYRYRPGANEFSHYVEAKTYRIVSGRKSS